MQDGEAGSWTTDRRVEDVNATASTKRMKNLLERTAINKWPIRSGVCVCCRTAACKTNKRATFRMVEMKAYIHRLLLQEYRNVLARNTSNNATKDPISSPPPRERIT